MADLITIEEAKRYLGINEEIIEHDNLIKTLITDISKYAEETCGRNFITAEYTEEYDGNGLIYLFLNQYPIISITTFTISDNDVESDRYKIYADWGEIRFKSRIFTEGKQNVDITYIAGLGATNKDLPADLKMAIKKLLKAEFLSAHTDNINITPAEMDKKIDRIKKDGEDILSKYKDMRC